MTEPTFGENLRAVRLGTSLSQSQLADRCGIPKPRLSEYENDHLRPSLETLIRLADALDVPPGRLLSTEWEPVEALARALRERGVRLGSVTDTEGLADAVARSLEGRGRAGSAGA